MSCNLGQVVDLSASGMRLFTRKHLTGQQMIILKGQDQKPMHLPAQVCWHRLHSKHEHVYGLRFERLTDSQRDQLENLVLAIANGQASPTPSTVSPLQLVGGWMGASAIALLVCALIWTSFSQSILSLAPGLYDLLSSIPELGALLVIAAGGCGLLAMTQRGAFEVTDTDTKSRHRAQAELDEVRRSQGTLNGILESSLGGVCVLETLRDETGEFDGFQIQLINPAGEQIIRKTEKELVGQTIGAVLPDLLSHELYRDLLSIVKNNEPIQKNYQVGQEGRWFLVAMVPLSDGIAVTFLDNTEAQRKGQQLKHIAYHDELTGLPNRKALIEHVDTSLQRCRRTPGHNSALLFLDFDRFKNVNDTLGHEAGDQLLIGIAKRLNENLRDGDIFTTNAGACLPARLGGDEFVVLLDGIRTKEDAMVVAERLLKVFKKPHRISGQQVTSTASIGIAVNHGEYEHSDDLLRDADSALYIAKQNGKARYVLFDQDMQDKLIHRIQLERDLRFALERRQFSLVYEPIIDLQTGKPVGFETLVRWHHHLHGEISPAEFIPIAESINYIGQIGRWVLDRACKQLATWSELGLKDVFLNVNMSRGQLYEDDLVVMFQGLINAYGFEPSRLRIELTESMVMNDLDFMADKLTQLKDLGLGLALDDFGTGYSSLNVLHKLPFDTLKIDRVFMQQAQHAMKVKGTHRNSAIISTITQLAEHLKLDVIAEGIQGNEQIATLQALACQYAQGWFFSKPLGPTHATEMLQNPTQHPACLSAMLDGEADLGQSA